MYYSHPGGLTFSSWPQTSYGLQWHLSLYIFLVQSHSHSLIDYLILCLSLNLNICPILHSQPFGLAGNQKGTSLCRHPLSAQLYVDVPKSAALLPLLEKNHLSIGGHFLWAHGPLPSHLLKNIIPSTVFFSPLYHQFPLFHQVISTSVQTCCCFFP